MRQVLAQKLEEADVEAQAASAIREWTELFIDDPNVTAALYVPMVKANLAGQLMVRGSEAGKVELKEDDLPQMLSLTFDQFLYRALARDWVTEGDMFALIAAYKKRALRNQRLMMESLSRRVFSELRRALSQGRTLREFITEINGGAIRLGMEPASHAYLENVFRTNVQMAYGAGRFKQMTDPDVIAVRPFVEYRTAGDGRVRSSHEALRGLVFRADSKAWHAIAPPNGYQCRCSVISRAADDVDGGQALDVLPQGLGADPGFGQSPVSILEAP